MLKKLNNNKGFTIIEVMIVLAIAGLIILIVLLAVPALQRNGRNTAIKNDASAVVAAVAEFNNNNDGAMPTAASSNQVGATVTIGGATGTSSVTGKIQSGTVYEDADNGASKDLTAVDAGKLFVYFKAKCPATPGATNVTTTNNPKSTAVVYVTETSNGFQTRCLDS